ncbi:MAG TPA: TlpA disulfide reductase family protein [Candidatus Polarisedimenticolaceae bacterium]|nr:TlpA disulfide reductase family protein [Candidatus Polarisedimenticolaceae bacterium]
MRDVVDRYEGRVGYKVENWGQSALAERMGVGRYPVVFVDDAVFAAPRDLGFYGSKETAGRYTPWRDPANHARFREDLIKLLDRMLAGERPPAGGKPAPETALAKLPSFSLASLDGKPVSHADLAGRPAVIEFWATWCVPCHTTLPFLGKLATEHPDLRVVAVAVESEEKDVRTAAAAFPSALTVGLGSPEVARAFGDLTAVPTTFVVDREGRVVSVVYGSPPDLEERLQRALRPLLSPSGR